MSILIKGIDMPKDGEQLCINIHPDGKVCISLDLSCEKVGTAVPVPPHGRLIDADALMRHCVMLPFDGGSLPVVYASYIRNAPTVIEAEEVYNKYTDTAGNLHWTGTKSGEHTIRAEGEKI